MENPYHPKMSNPNMDMQSRTPPITRIEKSVTWATFLYPVVMLGAYFGVWIFAWIQLGVMPKVNINDPKYLNLLFGYEITIFLLAGSPFAAFGGVFVQFAMHNRSFERRGMFTCLLILVWAVSIAVVLLTPFVGDWLFD